MKRYKSNRKESDMYLKMKTIKRLNGWMDECMNEQMNEWIKEGRNGWIDNGQVNKGRNGKWMDGWMEGMNTRDLINEWRE